MSFTSYLIRKFDYTHENQFFRKFSENLQKVFEEAYGEHILIGNISINGHALDALFICRGQISIIDFKDYSGKVSFSENNPWLLETKDGKQIFVQGGAQMRNPFQQVKAYRFSLLHFLQDNQAKILEGIRNDIQWAHIGAIVLFQNAIKFDNTSIPSPIKPWFHIVDKNAIEQLLISKHSAALELTDNEINKLLSILDVNSSNLLDRFNFQESSATTKIPAEKLALVKRLIKGEKSENKYKRIISYFSTLVNLERFKEPTISALHAFSFDTTQNLEKYSIPLSANNHFFPVWLTNLQERFPKNLFIGLDVVINGKGYPLLHTIILETDVQSKESIEVNLNQFELYSKALQDLGLGEDTVEELSTEINLAAKLAGKFEVFRSVLSASAEMGSRIYVGLSSENPVTLQLRSELDALTKRPEDSKNGLFNSFLFQENKLISTPATPLSLSPFVQITKLNSSQKQAIILSFSQNITVITGPPGTGKSQVVANILANAIVSNHKVLFASKNNKAVDNVVERLGELFSEKVVIRFGSKEELENNAKPALKRFLSIAGRGGFSNKVEELKSDIKNIEEKNKRLDKLNELLARIPFLEKKIVQLNEEHQNLEKNYVDWLYALNPEYKELFIDLLQVIRVDPNKIGLLLHKIQKAQKGFFSRLWFNLFSKKDVLKSVDNFNKGLPEKIYEYVQAYEPWVSFSLSLLASMERNLVFILNLSKAQKSIANTHRKFKTDLGTQENKISKINTELLELISNKSAFEAEIDAIEKELPTLGLKLVNTKLLQDLHSLDTFSVQSFTDALPANQIWKDHDVQQFTATAKTFLNNFHAACITSLSVKNSFPLNDELFDMVIIDEASQCDFASAIPLLYRSKRAVVIGDPLQLRHITSVEKYEDDFVAESLDLQSLGNRYTRDSLFDYAFTLANKCTLKGEFLAEHYRCHPEIINFSNMQFYQNRLGQTMKIQTLPEQFRYGNKGMQWVNVNGEMNKSQNINIAEANTCIDLAAQLYKQHPKCSIGIVTPFRDQYRYIFEKLPLNLKDHIKVDTVHRYQGDEKDIMILSLVITNNSPAGKVWFINRNDHLINVAITRARSTLYIVGNQKFCKEYNDGGQIKSSLRALADYYDLLNKVRPADSNI